MVPSLLLILLQFRLPRLPTPRRFMLSSLLSDRLVEISSLMLQRLPSPMPGLPLPLSALWLPLLTPTGVLSLALLGELLTPWLSEVWWRTPMGLLSLLNPWMLLLPGTLTSKLLSLPKNHNIF